MAVSLVAARIGLATGLTLGNSDFEGGVIAGTNNPVAWTTTENHPGAVYAENWGAGAPYLATLNLQARGNGNIIEQSFLTAEATADTYGSITVSMDLGTRANTGLARSIDVAVWNVTDGVSLASETYNFPTTGTGFIERRDFVLSYDNSDPSLAGDTIALRITSNGAGDTFATTHWLDNISVEGATLNGELLVVPGSGLGFAGNEGGPFTPSSITYTLTNNGQSAALSWAVSASASWVTVSPGSGTLAPGASVGVTASINSGADSLAAGSYQDILVFTDLAAQEEQNRSVNLEVSAVSGPGDSDGDGLPDDWEILNGLNPSDDGSTEPDNGAAGDPDGDGLPNDEEFFLGSDPQVNESGQPWQPRPAKARLMVVSAHPDDEGIFFGGVYPYYTRVRNLPTVGVSMTSGDAGTRPPEVREAEFRNAVWAYGLRCQPLFPRFKDYPRTYGIDRMWDIWADGVDDGGAPEQVAAGQLKATTTLATYMRRYRPDVVVTHDFDGEYGHTNHMGTALATTWALPMAADPATDLDGLPPWQVKKLYIHKYGTNPLFHDFWQVNSIDSDGNGSLDQNPVGAANAGLYFHLSQGSPSVSTCYASGETNSAWEAHPCEWWGLYFTAVGPDSTEADFIAPDQDNSPMTYSGWARGDFFENLTAFPDSDADELPDAWELAHFASLAAADPAGDDDGDGRDNRSEFVAGSDPVVPDAIDFRVDGSTWSVNFSVPAAVGPGYEGLTRRYQLLYSPDLQDWSIVFDEGIGDGNPRTLPMATGQDRAFYRLLVSVE